MNDDYRITQPAPTQPRRGGLLRPALWVVLILSAATNAIPGQGIDFSALADVLVLVADPLNELSVLQNDAAIGLVVAAGRRGSLAPALLAAP